MPTTGAGKRDTSFDAHASTTSQGGTPVNTAWTGSDDPVVNTAERSLMLIVELGGADADCQGLACDASQAASTAPNATPSTTIDLDRNGVPDLCQMRCGDLDLSGEIDQGDLAVLLMMVGTDPVLAIGDLYADGAIEAADLAVLATLCHPSTAQSN